MLDADLKQSDTHMKTRDLVWIVNVKSPKEAAAAAAAACAS